MMTPAQVSGIVLQTGATFRQEFQWTDDAGTPINFSTDVSLIRIKVRETPDAATALLSTDSNATPSTGTYVDKTNANVGKWVVWFNATATDAIFATRSAQDKTVYFDIEFVIPTGTALTSGVAAAIGVSGTTTFDIVITPVAGTFTVKPSVTY